MPTKRTPLEESMRQVLQIIYAKWDMQDTEENRERMREVLDRTPIRYIAALQEMTNGYKHTPKEILGTTFPAKGYDQMIVLDHIEFTSLCEHHLLPFGGVARVGYIPHPESGRVVGISKLARLVECFARRLQIQEKMTMEIGETLNDYLKPKAVGVICTASHSCLGCRGIKKASAKLITSFLSGAFKSEPDARAEFLGLR